MKRLLAVLAISGVARAGGAEVTRTQTSVSTSPTSTTTTPTPNVVAKKSETAAGEPDPDTVEAAGQANLESDAPRAGVMFSASVGAGLTLGDGVGRGPSVSFRVGHVATPLTVLTFELTGGSLLHQDRGSTQLRHNDDFSAMAGALHYVNASLWVRGASGLTVYTTDNNPAETHPAHGGIGGLLGFGIDFVRWHYLVLGLETFGQLSLVASKGAIINSGLCLGLTYY